MPKKRARAVKESVSLYDAKTHLSDLVDQAALGREFVIAKSGKPKARLVPFAPKGAVHVRKPGGAKGRVWIARDFDAPLPPGVLKLFGGGAG
ncbi:MAG: type II toxin-antitoxin system Phd/YefM family antitoxin [Gemmatimonadetes bacterium]|nr:type II toxin-antitoxin system Phd/YefM family antitoxin [Gemmatimonadota bacterium]